jgi:hypothetical protein
VTPPPPAERLSPRAFAALALALPVLLACAHFGRGHTGDIEFFHRWYLAVKEGAGFYRDGPGINYPIVGVVLVTGPALVLDGLRGHALDLATFTAALKSTLVLGEVALIIAAARLAGALGHPAPRSLAIVLYLLPSTWAGGAYFGQIDVWGTVLLLLCAERAIAYRRTGAAAALTLALGAFMLALLTKQLTLFALPALAALLAVGLRSHARPSHWLLVASSPVLLLAADPFLSLEAPYVSHLHFVLAHGSSHGDLVVASGASLWSLVAVGGTPSASLMWLGLDAQVWGWLGFTAALVAIALRTARQIRGHAPDDHATNRALVRAAGLSQLAMALLLTGVHERYLTHAIPLLILADGLWSESSSPLARARTGLAVTVAILSGLFVSSTIEPALEAIPILSRPQATAILSLAWAISLLLPSEAPPRAADSSG